MINAKILLAYLLQTASIFGIPTDVSHLDENEVYCLAKNVYYEARGEDMQGQIAVASVTVNRANNSNFPSSICEVVKQTTYVKKAKKEICSFSWYCESDKRDKEIVFINKNGDINEFSLEQFQLASIIAISVLSGLIEDNTNGATHFHNPYISSPAWARQYERTVRIGNHDFYRQKY